MDDHRHRPRSRTLLAVAVLSAVVGTSCERQRQHDTWTDMSTTCDEIAARRAEAGRPLSVAELRAAILVPSKGLDNWGHGLILIRGSDDHYLLISLGSDAVADVRNLSDYWRVPPSDIRADSRRDIVFRDGQSITMGGR